MPAASMTTMATCIVMAAVMSGSLQAADPDTSQGLCGNRTHTQIHKDRLRFIDSGRPDFGTGRVQEEKGVRTIYC